LTAATSSHDEIKEQRKLASVHYYPEGQKVSMQTRKNLISTSREDERLKRVSIAPKGAETYMTLVIQIKQTVGPREETETKPSVWLKLANRADGRSVS